MSISLFPRLLLLTLVLAGCGNKPDGTPYGVNPAKVASSQAQVKDSARRYDHYTKGMPKGAEINAITNGGTQGQIDQPMGQ